MPKKTPSNTVLKEGLEAFPENKKALIQIPINNRALEAVQMLFHPMYHGPLKPCCILVRKRKELTYQEHILDIYACYTCGLQHECLRSGWTVGYYGGTKSSELSNEGSEVTVHCDCGHEVPATTSNVINVIKTLFHAHEDGSHCKVRIKMVKGEKIVDHGQDSNDNGWYYPNIYWK